MKIKFFLLSVLILSLGLCISSCKRNNDNPLWNVDALAPLLQASLSMNNIVKDTSLVKKNPDNSITIVDRQQLASITLDSLIALNTPPFNKTSKLTSLVLDTKSDTTKITLRQIADALIASGGNNALIGAYIKSLDGQTNQTVPALPALSFNNLPIDASTLFTDANITSGTLSVQITNNLPIDIQTLDFDIKNKVDQATIITHSFSNLTANGGTSSASQDLSGKHVEGVLEGDITTLQLSGGSGVTIDLNQSIDVILTISGVSVSSATAIFPNQDVVTEGDQVSLLGLTNGIELTYAEIASGYLVVEVYSTVEQDLYFTYNVPSASKGGIPFVTQSVVTAAPSGQTSHKVFQYDFTGYAMDLTGQNHDTVNTFYNTLLGQIKYTGQKVYLSLSDSIVVSVSTLNLKPSYVRGYLGNDTINIGPSSASLDIFKNIESGTLNFENIKMNLVIDNGFGLDGTAKINTITASNTRTGASQTLTGPNISTPLTIAKATDHPYLSAVNTFDMSTSSNATSLINTLPNKVNYNAQVITNTAGNTKTYTDFAYNTGSFKAYLDIEMPLSIIASQLVLSDTVPFNTASIKKRNVNSGTLSVFVNNGFPLGASLKMYLLNGSGTVIDSLTSLPNAIMSAPVDGTFKVTSKQSSHLSFPIDATKMNNLYNTYKVIFKIEFTTQPNSNYLKIYSDYSIDFKLVGDLNYSVH
ncbi:MAG TPA: hypothetical protein VNW06_01190 [Cytophagaceae bacterium]|jgi:hypothetical protein|nr:hypothetical protein [Cytophagaceae bacterium]